MKTWVLAADFSKSGSFENSSPLIESLYSLGFENFHVFNHSMVFTPSRNEIQLKPQVRINPMSNLARMGRFMLRRLGESGSRRFIGKNFPDHLGLMIPHNLRHFLYKNMLRNFDYDDFVFLVDSRDLVFQISPIDLSQELVGIGKIHFFDESERYFKNLEKEQRISSSETNQNWLRQLENFIENPLVRSNHWIINSGCVAGTVESLLQFLELSTNQIAESDWRFDCILDQAATNLIAYANIISNAKIHANGDYVLNMCGVIRGEFEIIDGVLIKNKETIPIVHQWDRFGDYRKDDGISLWRRDYCELAQDYR